MSTAESRIRDALARGQAPSQQDMDELLRELVEVRRESNERWEAIGRLAPAAKSHRSRSQAQARTMADLNTHLDELAAMLAAPGELDPGALQAWLSRARELLSRTS